MHISNAILEYTVLFQKGLLFCILSNMYANGMRVWCLRNREICVLSAKSPSTRLKFEPTMVFACIRTASVASCAIAPLARTLPTICVLRLNVSAIVIPNLVCSYAIKKDLYHSLAPFSIQWVSFSSTLYFVQFVICHEQWLAR